MGNLVERTDRLGRAIAYDYDHLDRLTAERWGAGAFPGASAQTTNQGSATSEVQQVGMDINGFNPSGTFTLSFDGQTTGPIAWDASAATVQAALEGLSNIGPGDVAVEKTEEGSFAQHWRLTFQGGLAGAALPQTTIDASSVSLAQGTITEVELTDTQGGPDNEVQVVTVSDATGGTLALSFGGQTTGPIAWNAADAAVDAALEGLSTIDTVTVTGNAGGPWTITFTGTHAGQNVAQLTADGSSLTSSNLVRTLSFAYSAAGELVSASDPAATYTYSYDALSRVTSEGQTLAGLTPGLTYSSQYDALGRRTELQAMIGSSDDFQNTYIYDNLSRLTRLQQFGVQGGNAVAEKRVDFAYDASGAFTKIDRYADQTAAEHVASTHYSYDGMGRLTKLLHTEGPTAPGSGWGSDALAGYTYTYDAASRITSIDSYVDGLSEFDYDLTDQLTGADHTGQTDETYTYDANGNRTNTGYSTGDNNQLDSDGTYNYTYDFEGNRATKTKISNGEKEEYAWDHRNRLTGVTFKNSGGTVLKTVEQTYDVFDRWIKRRVDPDGPGPAAAVDTFFSHFEDQIALEFDGPTAADLTHRYLWGPVIDQILADEAVTSLTSPGTVLWPLADHLGTPRDLATYNTTTDDTAVANHRLYDTFGILVSETNASFSTIVGFTGAIFEVTTGLNYHRARWYDLKTGRWMSEDPSGLAPDRNLARYVNNHAPNSIDPTGWWEQPTSDNNSPDFPKLERPVIVTIPTIPRYGPGGNASLPLRTASDPSFEQLAETANSLILGEDDMEAVRRRPESHNATVDLYLRNFCPIFSDLIDVGEVVTGENMTTGKTLTRTEYGVTLLGLAAPLVVGAGFLRNVFKRGGDKIDDVMDVADDSLRTIDGDYIGVAELAENAKLPKQQGREFRVDQLELFEFDPNAPSHVQGWLQNERRRVEQGKALYPRNPPGYELSHGRATPAREGYDYSSARLQTCDLNHLEESIRRRARKP